MKRINGSVKLYLVFVVLMLLTAALAVPAFAGGIATEGNVNFLLSGMDTEGAWDWAIQESLRLKFTGDGPASTGWQGEFNVSSPGALSLTGERAPFDLQVDRLFFRWEEGGTRLTLGRQRIAWGVGYAFSPLDQFNPPNPGDPIAPRQGVDALVIRRSMGDLSYLSLVGVLPETIDGNRKIISTDPAVGGIWGTHIGNTDLSLSYLSDPVKEDHQWGLAAKGDLGVGWHLEGVYQKLWDTNTGPVEGAPAKSQWLGVLGLDYSFLDGKVLSMVEYLYDETGEPDPARYGYDLRLTGQRQTLGTRYLFSQVSYQVDEFAGLSLSALANLADRSGTVQPALNWQVDDNTRVDLGVAVPVGDRGTEFKTVIPGQPAPAAVLTIKARYSF
ncbi:MAG: hypothetical protein ACM3TT_09960 [Syntrophothermus sp.]